MSFERLEIREKTGRSGLPASISLSSLNGGRPAVMVTITESLVDGAGCSTGDRFHALIGRDDDAGKIRLERAADGLLAPRILKSNSMLLNLGYVEAIGTEPHKKQFTSARVIAAGVVEIDLPPFDDDTREPAPRLLLPAPARPPSATGSSAGKKAAPADGGTFNGVTIDQTLDNESITFKGKSTEVTTRQAKMVRLLARPRPEPVGEAFLIKSLWDRPPADAKDQLRTIASDLQKGLSPIGLNLAPVRGVGYQLKDL